MYAYRFYMKVILAVLYINIRRMIGCETITNFYEKKKEFYFAH